MRITVRVENLAVTCRSNSAAAAAAAATAAAAAAATAATTTRTTENNNKQHKQDPANASKHPKASASATASHQQQPKSGPTSSGESRQQLLEGICAYVKPGQIMAVMGASGCGKTTLLSALSGRRPLSGGRLQLNGQPMSKSLRRQICYVLQSDVFFANLTLRQTLEYTALLRLPDRMGRPEKMRKVDEVIAALDLKSCEQTLVGDFSLPGLSGGQKKRLSIACELLSNPAVMLLDEPTSSLDSCTALNLMKLLRDYAQREQKTIIISIHQPSSQIFHMFDKLLLLAHGQMLYFGSPQQAMPFFAHFSYRPNPDLSYNPADYLLEISKQMDSRELHKISLAARSTFHANYKAAQQCSSMTMTMTTGCQSSVKSSSGSSTLSCSGSTHSSRNLHSPGPNHHAHYQNENSDHQQHLKHESSQRISHSFVDPPTPSPPPAQANHQASYYAHNNVNHTNHHQNLIFESPSFHGSMSKIYIHEHDFDCASSSGGPAELDDLDHLEHPSTSSTTATITTSKYAAPIKRHEWPSSFYTQVCALTSRNFIEARARVLSKLNWIQTIGIALISGSMWFQLARNEDSLEDVKGWIYFSTTYWMMVSLFSTLATIPQESQLISKERLGGYYRLSAYYVAKMIAELPLIVALPTVYHLISYPMLGLHSMQTFFIMWLMVILNSIAAQSVGILIGYSFKRIDVSLVVASLYSTSTMLFAGFYAKNIPACLTWYRFLSLIYYGFLNMQLIEYTTGPPVTCAIKNSKFPSCNRNPQALQATTASPGNGLISAKNLTHITKYVDKSELLWGIDRFRPTEEPTPMWFNTLCLIIFLFVFRFLGYLVLRSYHKPS